MADKKRKRTDEPPPPPHKTQKKNVSFGSSPHAIRVSSLARPKLSPPVIATTPGLCLPVSVTFDSYAKTETADGKRKASQPVLKDLVLHSCAHKTVDYTGREDRLQGDDGLLRHFIGVFDPKTGKLEVVEARKLILRGSVRVQQASAKAMGDVQEKQAATELRTDLGQTFGTKKAKKALVERAENAITTQAVYGDGTNRSRDAGEDALLASLEGTTADMLTLQQLQAAVDGAKPVPKGNYSADEIQDVYDPEEIIGPDILISIPVRDWQEAINSGNAIQLHSRYVANRVRRVNEHEEAVKRLRIMRYLYFLILFWIKAKAGKRDTKRILPMEKLKAELAPAPDLVIESLRKKFSDHGDMRKAHVDLLMTTCCVLASIIDSFEVDTFDLREDLRLEQKQLNQYFHEIGARTKVLKGVNKNNTVAKLALPLEFPKIRRPKRT